MENKIIRKKRGKFFNCFIVAVIFVIILLVGAFAAINWYNNAIYLPSERTGEVEYLVEEGSTLTNIAEILEEKGVIKNKDAFKIYLRLNNLSPNIKAGEYNLRKDLSVPELIKILEDGVFKPSVAITVVEGLWDEDIAEIFDSALSKAGSEKKFSITEFKNIVQSPDSYIFSNPTQEFLKLAKPDGKPLTGYLFPDTYRVNSDATAQQVIEIMVLNLKKRLSDNQIDPENVQINQNRLSDFYEALILSSILEREAGRDDPIEIVSGVFHNRLRVGMGLESDATVNFATGKNVRGASFEDLKFDSPYNTYKYTGLPPTPINNPGIRSIKASINPATTDYLFFWHASLDNKIYFGRTFGEHNANIRNYP